MIVRRLKPPTKQNPAEAISDLKDGVWYKMFTQVTAEEVKQLQPRRHDMISLSACS
jgi:hypothetical protein